MGNKGDWTILSVPMVKLKSKLLERKCFTRGEVGHVQRECPYMECMWAKALRAPQVMAEDSVSFFHLVIPIRLNERQVDALVDMCG